MVKHTDLAPGNERRAILTFDLSSMDRSRILNAKLSLKMGVQWSRIFGSRARLEICCLWDQRGFCVVLVRKFFDLGRREFLRGRTAPTRLRDTARRF